jgi:hypothetical protein
MQYPDIICHDLSVCDACHRAKQRRLPFPVSKSNSSRCFDLIHVDIWGPLSIPTFEGYRYFLTIVDDYTRFTWIRLMKYKADVKVLLPSFINTFEKQFGVHLKRLQSDNGKEFLLHDFYKEKGIFHETACVYTPQQN